MTPRSVKVVALAAAAMLCSGCLGLKDSEGPITVTLSWNDPVDLDLLVDEQPAYRQGGTADQQSGGEEAYTIPRGSGDYVIAVQNLSGHASASPRVAVNGVWEKSEGLALSFGDKPFTMEGSVHPKARSDRWVVCAVNSKSGEITRIDKLE